MDTQVHAPQNRSARYWMNQTISVAIVRVRIMDHSTVSAHSAGVKIINAVKKGLMTWCRQGNREP